MSVPRDHHISRPGEDPQFIKATWGFNDSEFAGTNRNFQVISDNGERYTVPEADGCWSDSESQKRDEGYVVFPERHFPNTNNRLNRVEHHVQMQAHNGYHDGALSVVTYQFYKPFSPNVKLTQDGRKLSWEIDSRASEMGNTSHYYWGNEVQKTKTVFWVQSRREGEGWRYIDPADKNYTGYFESDKQKHTHKMTAASDILVPSKPIQYRLVASNWAPTGPSNLGGTDISDSAHVFAKVTKPTVKIETINNNTGSEFVTFAVTTNNTMWHPVDAVILERCEVSKASDANYNTTIEQENRVDVANKIKMSDTSYNQMPAEDKAMFYRIMTYHDSKTANCAYGYPANPVRAGKPKAPSNVIVTPGTSTTVTWNLNSTACDPYYLVELHIKYNGVWQTRVHDSPKVRIPAGQVPSTLSYDFEDVDTSHGGIDEVWATVVAVKEWGGAAGTKRSAVIKSEHSKIPSIQPLMLQDDGVSILVMETHSSDDFDTTEYSWSKRGDGWESTDTPKTFQVKDTGLSSRLVITDLDEGVEYYVKCRRYDSSSKAYGLYSSMVSTKTGTVPGIPTLTSPDIVGSGKGIEYTWDFRGAEQTEAELRISYNLKRIDTFIGDGTKTVFDLDSEMTGKVDRFIGNGTKTRFDLTFPTDYIVSVFVDDQPVSNYTLSGYTAIVFESAPSNGAVIDAGYYPRPTVKVDGEETSGFSTVDEDSIEMSIAPDDDSIIEIEYGAKSGTESIKVSGADQGYVFETDPNMSGTIIASVLVTCGNFWSSPSNEVTTDIREAPVCTIEPAGTLTSGDVYGGNVLTALPLSVDLGGTGDSWELTLTAANDTNEPTPAGDNITQAGTVVARAKTSSGTVDPLYPQLPFEFISDIGIIATGGQYDISCVCVDSKTGLKSEPATIGFSANWSVSGVEPVISVEMVNDKAHVTVSRGTGDVSTTKLSIWRVTADGAILCVEDAGNSVMYIDKVPPYQWSLCRYIAQSTTVDGDIRWVEGFYSYKNSGVTIDFNNTKVVLPFNIKLKDGYSNVFEKRTHMDGSRVGSWEPGVDRTGSVSGQLPSEGYDETYSLLRDLGRYSGICFARDVNGIAFPCHAEVNISSEYCNVVTDIDIKLTEVDDDGTWNLTSSPVPKPEPENESEIEGA